MSIALFALAAVMIVGGIVSVIQGFPFVRLESGLAMTIAGATTASAGAVVLGLAVIARRLGTLARVPREAPRAEALPVEAAESELPPSLRQRPSLAATAAGLGALGGAGLGAAALRSGREPTFFDPAPPPPAPEEAAAAAEPLLPNLLPEEDASAQPAEPRREEPYREVPSQPEADDTEFHEPAPPAHQPEEEMLFGAPAPEAPKPAAEPEPVILRPALVEPEPVAQEPVDEPVAHQPEPEPVAPAPVEAPQAEPEPPAEPERQVVGTYASGGNTYVMFSTGVIEAETPRGRYTFASLDELKAFVEAGGETDARGAA
ncbi:hypothetical protein [Methylobacterium goesingense]|uniref:DUF308 domain-containing protein n=1 Tax=Methylobacterium goesingense TaxID=243690 RepID=A0ABV2L2M6_9HYPH